MTIPPEELADRLRSALDSLPVPERSWAAAHAQIIQRRKTRRQDTAVRLREWLSPLAAAAAVVIAITVPLAIFHSHAAPTAAAGRTASGPGGAPPFYMFSPPDGRYAAVAATATGKTLVTVKPPRGTSSIGPLGAAADDRTFLLGAGISRKGAGVALFLLRFHPQTRTASVTSLPVHVKTPANTEPAFALSPDGTRLALIDFGLTAKRPVLAITVFTLATGSHRTWTVRVAGLTPDAGAQTWSANGRQVQVVWTQGLAARVLGERLDTAVPGTHLPPPAQLPIPSRLTRTTRYMYVDPDGDVFLPVGAYRPTWTLTEFSPHTGRLTRIMGPVRTTKITPSVDWASNAGHVLIISGRDGGLGVLHNGRYLPLPLPAILRKPLTSTVW